MQHEVGELLADKYPAEEAKEVAKLLTSGTWTHDYPIIYERAISACVSEVTCPKRSWT